jgi:hypothetical protein
MRVECFIASFAFSKIADSAEKPIQFLFRFGVVVARQVSLRGA